MSIENPRSENKINIDTPSADYLRDKFNDNENDPTKKTRRRMTRFGAVATILSGVGSLFAIGVTANYLGDLKEAQDRMDNQPNAEGPQVPGQAEEPGNPNQNEVPVNPADPNISEGPYVEVETDPYVEFDSISSRVEIIENGQSYESEEDLQRDLEVSVDDASTAVEAGKIIGDRIVGVITTNDNLFENQPSAVDYIDGDPTESTEAGTRLDEISQWKKEIYSNALTISPEDTNFSESSVPTSSLNDLFENLAVDMQATQRAALSFDGEAQSLSTWEASASIYDEEANVVTLSFEVNDPNTGETYVHEMLASLAKSETADGEKWVVRGIIPMQVAGEEYNPEGPEEVLIRSRQI